MDININYKGRTFNVKNISIEGEGITIKGEYTNENKQIHKNEIYSDDGRTYYPYTITETSQKITIIIPSQDMMVFLEDEVISKYEGED